MQFYLELDDYVDKAETTETKLRAVNFEKALQEARVLYMKKPSHWVAGDEEAYPRRPRLMCYL